MSVSLIKWKAHLLNTSFISQRKDRDVALPEGTEVPAGMHPAKHSSDAHVLRMLPVRLALKSTALRI